jgi:hypothetical protein
MLCRISSRDAQVNPDARKMKVSEAGDEASAGETAATRRRTVENRARGDLEQERETSDRVQTTKEQKCGKNDDKYY